MKTNPSARGILRIRFMVLSLAIVGLALAEVGVGASLAARFGHYTAARTQAPRAPSLGVADLMAAGPVVR